MGLEMCIRDRYSCAPSTYTTCVAAGGDSSDRTTTAATSRVATVGTLCSGGKKFGRMLWCCAAGSTLRRFSVNEPARTKVETAPVFFSASSKTWRPTMGPVPAGFSAPHEDSRTT